MGPIITGSVVCILAYLLGSVSFGLVAAARRGVALREQGSGNTGATNVGRVLGKNTGRAVMALDAAKGFVPALVARSLLGPAEPWAAAAGLLAVVGHCFPIWHRFRGGKGAATAAGVMLGLVPSAGIAALVVFVVLRKSSGKASIGSLGGAAAGTLATLALLELTDPRTWMACAVFALVVFRHLDNLRRLWRGQEQEAS